MSASGSSLWTKTVAVGVIAVASVVGNVSLSASEARQPVTSTYSPVGADGVASPSSSLSQAIAFPVSRLAPETMSSFNYSKFDFRSIADEPEALPSPLSDVREVSPRSEFGQVVPAIYAWDPDVRFVFYRHVSKWM